MRRTRQLSLLTEVPIVVSHQRVAFVQDRDGVWKRLSAVLRRVAFQDARESRLFRAAKCNDRSRNRCELDNLSGLVGLPGHGLHAICSSLIRRTVDIAFASCVSVPGADAAI